MNQTVHQPQTIWIVEDHLQYREALCSQFERRHSKEFRPVGFASAEEALVCLRREGEELPSLALLDIELPGQDGVAFLRELKTSSGSCKALMLTTHSDNGIVSRSIKEGADGFLLKTSSFGYLVESLRLIGQGGLAIDPRITRYLIEEQTAKPRKTADDITLSEQQRIIVRFLADGLLKKEISEEMSLSIHTVDAYLRRIYKKLSVNNKNAAIVAAIRHGIIDCPS